MLNTLMENENKSLSNILIFFPEIMVLITMIIIICDHDLRKKVEIFCFPLL